MRPPWRRLFAVSTAVVTAAVSLTSAPATAAEGPIVGVGYRTPYPTMVRGDVTYVIDAGVGWPAEAEGAVVAALDVRVARTSMTAAARAPWAYPARLQRLPVTTGERHQGNLDVRKVLGFSVAQGQVLCISARAADTRGNVGDWSEQVCVTRFLDDRRLERHATTKRISSSRDWAGSATSLGRHGSLVLRGVPRGGRVVVLWARGTYGHLDGDVDVTGPGATRAVRLCTLGAWAERPRYQLREDCPRVPARRGPVRLRFVGPSATVAIEGIAVVPRWAEHRP